MARTVTTGQNYKTEVRFGASQPANVEFVPPPSVDTPEEFQRFTELARKPAQVSKSELDEKRKTEP
jgi:hypothetical protein